MARLILALAVLALLTTVAVYIGEVIGERREHRRTAADFHLLRAEVHQQHAALMAIPTDAVDHGQQVAAEHHARWQPAVARLAAHFTTREAA